MRGTNCPLLACTGQKREGSVVVHFDLLFSGVVDSNTAQDQLVEGLQQGDAGSDEGLMIDISSVQVKDKETTTQRPSTAKPATPVKCPDGQKACADGTTCVSQTQFCDGIHNCPDGSDENLSVCATVCDGQFLLVGLTGFFNSKNFPLEYDSNTACHWIIRVNEGLAIRIVFHSFYMEEDIDVLELYEGIGPMKKLTYSLSGMSPGNIWLLSHEATVGFYADFINNFQGFNASYRAENISQLSNEDKINCSFEEDFCFWRQEQEDDGDWLRVRGSTLPPETGPSFDHTRGNQSGYYFVTPRSPGSLDKKFCIYSVPLSPVNESMCLRFWYHMFGEEVSRLSVMVEERSALTLLFQKEGTYGDNWNYGQVTLNYKTDAVVVFEAQKKAGFLNDIALDDISIVPGSCLDGPPDPTPVPPPITSPPVPTCGVRKVPLQNEPNKDTEMGQIAGKVVGGQDAQEGAWPWIVSLRWQGRHVCGASLIDREWLVTAAHCVFGMNVYLSNWAAVLGLHTQFGTDNSDRQVHSVDQIIMNKHYNRRTKESDFALMHLQTPANFTDYIQPICLPDPGEHFEVWKKCSIAGWGKLAEDGSVANVLQQAVLPLLNNAQCQEWLPEYNITERIVCAGYAEGEVDSCQGDSGGPLMCEEDDHWVLEGVTSFGKVCGQPQRPGVYARVSQFVDWVVETRRLYSDWKG